MLWVETAPAPAGLLWSASTTSVSSVSSYWGAGGSAAGVEGACFFPATGVAALGFVAGVADGVVIGDVRAGSTRSVAGRLVATAGTTGPSVIAGPDDCSSPVEALSDPDPELGCVPEDGGD
ncbi:MAG TPA: hypothetical protein VKI65_08880, partial [Gemmataceae bacterium]|nr:hypothetical protein [Gemmataceae bacterium]